MKNFQRWMTGALFLQILLMQLSIHAQDIPIQNDSFYSKILGEERALQIAFPDGYKKDSAMEYEIIYVLDGFSNFMKTPWSFLQGEGFIPKNMIMVGVNNTIKDGMDMRNRDFTPTHTGSVTGGADKFISFFKDELMPFINKKYHGKEKGHTLYGGSLGGLFALYLLMKQPDLFTSYIAIDPALWWDNFLIIKQLPEVFKTRNSFHQTLYIAGREGRPYHFMGVAAIDSLLQKKAPPGLDWQVDIYKNDTHYSTNFKGFYEGLKFSYGGFYASTGGYPASRKVIIKPHFGTVLKNGRFYLTCYNLAPYKNIHYSINGQEPTRLSPKLSGDETPLTLQKDSKIIVKSIGMRDGYNRSDTAWFKVSNAVASIAKPAKVVPGALKYSLYEGIQNTAGIKNMSPYTTGTAGVNFDAASFGVDKEYTCILEGYMEMTKAGHYILEMGDGNELTKVYLANQQILGKHYSSSAGEAYMLPLKKGFYPIRIEYFHKKGSVYMEWIYLKPEGLDDLPLPFTMLYAEQK